MRFLSLVFLLILPVANILSADAIRASTACELAAAQKLNRTGIPFDFEATVVLRGTVGTRHFAARDRTGTAYLTLAHDFPRERLGLGTRIRIAGETRDDDRGIAYALCKRIDILGRENAPSPCDVTPAELVNDCRDGDFVRLRATVCDIFVDEIAPKWIYLDLAEGSLHIIAAHIPDAPLPTLEYLIGTQIALSGIYTRPIQNDRTHTGLMIYSHGSESLVPLQVPIPDPFEVPVLPPTVNLRPDDYRTLGRVRYCGTVIASWGQTHFLVDSQAGDVHRVDLIRPPVPKCGDAVEVVGTPETDLYRVNFSRAIWRSAPSSSSTRTEAGILALRDIFSDESGNPCIRTKYHGKTHTVEGVVRGLPATGNDSGRLSLENGNYVLPVDISACSNALRGVSVGCTIRVTGTCVIDIPNAQPNCIVPRIKEFFLAVRTPEDIEILHQPPWWTPARALSVLGALVLVLAGIIVWNVQLHRRAERRSRELARESIAHAESDLKTIERTRLAVDIHDSVSQSLTGIAMEIEAALQFRERAHAELLRHLDIAWRTLRACRAELRNCLWDLRNNALEERDMETAIRRTLLPHLESVQLAIRFSVPREKLSDNTTHAILRIVRELSVNAIRHGHATELKVAGSIEGDLLRFSVRDNGNGFDPKTAPGVIQGHFGLQGIRERTHLLHGDMSIERLSHGKGMRVTIALKIPHDIN